jgi:hypothetical protein
VLAFEEAAVYPSRSSGLSTSYMLTPTHARAQSHTMFSSTNSRPSKPPTICTTTYSKRPRAPSDPFLDVTPLPSSQSPIVTSSMTLSDPASDQVDENTPHADDEVLGAEPARQDPFSEHDSQMRVWTSPDMPNPEYISLLNVFPSSVTGRSLPRFPLSRLSNRKADIEEGELGSPEGVFTIRYGTGSISLSAQERSDGWQGSWWTRFIMWCRTLFC